jgi:hypothetical protein
MYRGCEPLYVLQTGQGWRHGAHLINDWCRWEYLQPVGIILENASHSKSGASQALPMLLPSTDSSRTMNKTQEPCINQQELDYEPNNYKGLTTRPIQTTIHEPQKPLRLEEKTDASLQGSEEPSRSALTLLYWWRNKRLTEFANFTEPFL